MYSAFDDAFISQKKNHFQITVNASVANQPKYFKYKLVKQFHEISGFQINFYGIHKESESKIVPIKQTDKNRKPMDYEPIDCHLKIIETNKWTIKRLHFAYTTHNNNRKKNKPNPDQRYFLLVVEMSVLASNGNKFILFNSISEPIIVRVSSCVRQPRNPIGFVFYNRFLLSLFKGCQSWSIQQSRKRGQ
jgi:hypothetical protein